MKQKIECLSAVWILDCHQFDSTEPSEIEKKLHVVCALNAVCILKCQHAL